MTQFGKLFFVSMLKKGGRETQEIGKMHRKLPVKAKAKTCWISSAESIIIRVSKINKNPMEKAAKFMHGLC